MNCGFFEAVGIVVAVALYQAVTYPYRLATALLDRLRRGVGRPPATGREATTCCTRSSRSNGR